MLVLTHELGFVEDRARDVLCDRLGLFDYILLCISFVHQLFEVEIEPFFESLFVHAALGNELTSSRLPLIESVAVVVLDEVRVVGLAVVVWPAHKLTCQHVVDLVSDAPLVHIFIGKGAERIPRFQIAHCLTGVAIRL